MTDKQVLDRIRGDLEAARHAVHAAESRVHELEDDRSVVLALQGCKCGSRGEYRCSSCSHSHALRKKGWTRETIAARYAGLIGV